MSGKKDCNFKLSRSLKKPFTSISILGDNNSLLNSSNVLASESVSQDVENIDINNAFKIIDSDAQMPKYPSNIRKRDAKFQDVINEQADTQSITIKFDDASLAIFKDVAYQSKRQADYLEKLM